VTDDGVVVDQFELACRLLDDDRTVLGEILAHFGGGIMGFLVAKYQDFNHQDAEDVLSIAIGKLWDSRQQYDESKGTLRTYLFRIADNTAKDVFKAGWAKAKQLPLDFGDENDIDLVPEPPPASETRRQRKDREKREKKELEELESVIASLPEKQRRIIGSDAFAKDRVSDSVKLADELGIPVGTVRVYRHRAWKTIRQTMKKLGYELPPAGDDHGE